MLANSEEGGPGLWQGLPQAPDLASPMRLLPEIDVPVNATATSNRGTDKNVNFTSRQQRNRAFSDKEQILKFLF